MTRLPGSASGAWFAAPRSPWLTPFSPSPPPTAGRLCSRTSSIVRSHPTSSSRASSGYGFRPFRCGPQFHLLRATRGSPSSRVQSVLACMGSSTTPGRTDARALAPAHVAFRFGSHRRHPGLLVFEAQYPARLSPCQRFARSFAGCTRMTRGHRGSRLLRCEALSSSTLYRFCWRTIGMVPVRTALARCYRGETKPRGCGQPQALIRTDLADSPLYIAAPTLPAQCSRSHSSASTPLYPSNSPPPAKTAWFCVLD